jgi:hypothetical protein
MLKHVARSSSLALESSDWGKEFDLAGKENV